ncbi:hypothetical protein Dace_2726 [Desulfuromonas acetoxidans DSM 684]|uniref:Uncharacterized protein n=1 Tax=Desulfuromonas acetoxidans (strain DSM 684 / 11070) TaxID=281689 RepID=Q1K208_DESA6|nr:hypothetical protein Dace_2726 [Desulfuromonas acetoxidans DSM 684]
MPTTIALTFIAFGAAERESLAAKYHSEEGWALPTRLFGATEEIEDGLTNELPRRKQRGINSLQSLLNHAVNCGVLSPNCE